MKCPFVIKVCSKCKRILVANEINFNKRKDSKDGLRNECKICKKKMSKKYRENNKDILKKSNKKWRENNVEKIKKYKKEYRENNKEKIKKKRKIYYKKNKEIAKEKRKEYYEINKEDILSKCKKYRENNPHILFNSNNKRKQLEENQGNGINKEQWLEMMDFFDWCCAYSGEYIGGYNENNHRTIDHIVPLSLNGEHEIWNCVPMLKKYNSSKNNSNMIDWYMSQDFFDINKLLKIFEWIEYAWNKWGN